MKRVLPRLRIHARRNKVVILATSLYLLVLAVYGSWFSGQLSTKQDHWGQFGDFVGGLVNPAFSLIVIYLLLATLRLQRRELALTRQELAKSSSSLDAQVRQFDTKARKDELYATADKVLADVLEVARREVWVRTRLKRVDGALERVKETKPLHIILGSVDNTEYDPKTIEIARSYSTELESRLHELAYYLIEIDEIPGTSELTTDFHRRRVQWVLNVLDCSTPMMKKTSAVLMPRVLFGVFISSGA